MMLSLVVALLAGSAYAQKLAWGYEGNISAANWGSSYPMCNGPTQSGIDIITERAVRDPGVCRELRTGDWTMVGSAHTAFRVKYYGTSMSFTPVAQDPATKQWVARNLRDNAIARLRNQFGRFADVHREFCFHSFHFHWGSKDEGGSEHNVNGVRYPLEVHFVHYSCDYANISAALSDPAPRDAYTLGVVGIMFQLGNAANPGFEDILTAKEHIASSQSANEFVIRNLLLKHLLPRDVTHLDFYGYMGSLTTPPCNPVVRWHVLKRVVTISPEQLARFKNMSASVKFQISKNYRPVQNNRNDVYDCSKPVSVPGTPGQVAVSTAGPANNPAGGANASGARVASLCAALLALVLAVVQL